VPQPHPHLVIGGQEVRGKVQLAQKRDQPADRFLGPGPVAVLAVVWLGGELAAPGRPAVTARVLGSGSVAKLPTRISASIR
jgi:hypothetical protein